MEVPLPAAGAGVIPGFDEITVYVKAVPVDIVVRSKVYGSPEQTASDVLVPVGASKIVRVTSDLDALTQPKLLLTSA